LPWEIEQDKTPATVLKVPALENGFQCSRYQSS
jgi:hypothetical protein